MYDRKIGTIIYMKGGMKCDDVKQRNDSDDVKRKAAVDDAGGGDIMRCWVIVASGDV